MYFLILIYNSCEQQANLAYPTAVGSDFYFFRTILLTWLSGRMRSWMDFSAWIAEGGGWSGVGGWA